jgi:hypothetical protein
MSDQSLVRGGVLAASGSGRLGHPRGLAPIPPRPADGAAGGYRIRVGVARQVMEKPVLIAAVNEELVTCRV